MPARTRPTCLYSLSNLSLLAMKRMRGRRPSCGALSRKPSKKYYNINNPAEIEQQAEKEAPLEEVSGDWTVSTDPSAQIGTLNKLFDSGATIVNVHSRQPDQHRVINFYANDVLPSLRNRS
jgi:hypothetical protein